ncbi:efflux RND transporter periplasmic adaptor subunit [Dyadobacter fanqingshengii]|uniref:Efflux RND transporter periplasmic adaptor subunit n=1 Tax=Dyadobacter fanqingshengii TaxID=2906443 RepID=A0A9X1PAB1_9BACT|nr:efflux RND transporter periplasmic adaptor subunit [Dyadobacter fanqingshengii]MCF0039612.1 efflux RND transporter periplasmic adaptor subunit [Dyadobacter fanqingshengii]MCF2502848.1 efflux RND transporter periplasmic adaptor subunit [Dyadobacter fanqingshengii]USJ38621.1 efflux RND transporter periplasmic adaptor subunit [Dyadobacter fanqingshengii]
MKSNTKSVFSIIPNLNKSLSLVIISGTLLATLSCKEKKDTFQAKGGGGPTIVDVIVVKSEKVSDKVEVNGTIVANEFAELRPEVSGLLTYLNVPEGRTVTKGTVIARINNADLQAQLSRTKVQLELAETTQQRLKQLVAVNGINQADYDLAVNQVNTLKADMVYTQALIDKTIVRAPFTGVIGLRKVSEGSFVTSTSVISTMQQLSNLRIDFTIPEIFQKYVQKGINVEVLLDQNSGKRQTARIIALEPQVNQSTRNITVRAVLNSGSTSPGSFAKVYLNASTNKASILIPTNCIIPEAMGKKAVVVKGGKAVFVDIQTGDRREDVVEVTSGLNVGDTVVVSGVLFARPDAPVKVRSVKSLNVAK